ncbi:MAG: TonB-dependent receptor plug domain-containing protein [Flavobacterium sp.]
MKNCYYLWVFVFVFQLKAQENDTITVLKEVVLTGQFEPQSLKKSVHNVRIISRKDIENQAANNLADVLNQYLNITILPDAGTGQSTVSMFGLDGSYFKILIDNVPIISDNSMGNSIDLTQINLDDIEQIEIIEGSMGVTHGANAVSGILNIITKKSSKYKWQIHAFVQEETVGEEYALFNQGRHIQSVKISNQISKHWFASLGVNRNDFRGFLDGKKGINHTESDLERGFTWLPREQFFTNATLNYHKNNFRAFYKFDYLNETIDFYNASVFSIANPPFGVDFFANDARFLTSRLFHHLNASGSWFDLKYNVSLSHQNQLRENEQFRYNFQNQNEENVVLERNVETNILYSTGTVNNFFKDKKYDVQLGYELINTLGFAMVDGENQTKVGIDRRLENYDFFGVSEINFNEKFSLRPGFRVSLQSFFDTQYASSLGLKYLFDNNWESRFSIGRSFRVPTFDELFSKIKFSGHQFYGNENLIPEKSVSYELSAKKRFSFENKALESRFSLSFLDVEDRIEMAFVGFEDNAPVYQYININAFQMWNVSTNQAFEIGKFNLNVGAILVGVSQVIDDGEAVSDDRFLYNFNINTSLNYDLTRWNTHFSLYYKYNGRQQQFQRTAENGEAIYRLSELEGFSFMDASIRKSFYKKQLEITVGARNLLDVTRINQGFSGEAHSASSAIVLGYGRSYFLKLLYHFNI